MIKENLEALRSQLPAGVELNAVSKFNAPERIQEAYDAGQRIFGESRVQELLTKTDVLPGDINWHFIGHLQTNKVRQVVGRVTLIESIDSEKLLALVDKEAEKKDVCQDVLLQLHVAAEETKFGFSPDELYAFMATKPWERFKHIRLRGVMGMASNVDDRERIREDFRTIRSVFNTLKDRYGAELPCFNIVSMGMSGDWHEALECGSTMVRIGSGIFGQRMYNNHK
ncbi:yggS family pyridoxal phosphate enzyme [Prevotella sp. CAG:485]|nr:yggS family pyridoxal phosphate enzyme [Prevotella sp. CAG:485]